MFGWQSRKRLGVIGAVAMATFALFISGCAATNTKPHEQSLATCRSYTTQAAAQRAWEAAGRPAARDRDGDGRVCENLREAQRASGAQTSCTRSARVAIVTLNPRKYPGTAGHTKDAIAAGKPAVLHIDRSGADENRGESLAGIPTKPGYDRDEYPPAVSTEGGHGADVRYVVSADNRGAGSSMGYQLRRYCDGQAFKIRGHD